jgi:hypothetical protein
VSQQLLLAFFAPSRLKYSNREGAKKAKESKAIPEYFP